MACEGLILPCETKRNETKRNEAKQKRILDILYSAQHGNQQQQDKNKRKFASQWNGRGP